jgi:exo-beta-1,3-glucanase (GH17 family)
MSRHYKRTLSLAGVDVESVGVDALRQLVRDALDHKIHGLSFSPYIEGQGPGAIVGENQIRERLAVIEPHVRWIRTFSCSLGHELIPEIAHEMGLKTLVGVWLDDDIENNELELENAIRIAGNGHVDILGVGNEVLLRGDLTADDLLGYISHAKTALPDVEVGYVDAYFQFAEYPRITEACDVLLANCYPFWESCPAEHALLYTKEMYRRAESVANGKRVIISETGWPNTGMPEGAAVPSYENAIKYFIDTYRWAETDGTEIFYFSSFDESWKVDAEGDVGAYWGLWNKDGQLKYG